MLIPSAFAGWLEIVDEEPLALGDVICYPGTHPATANDDSDQCYPIRHSAGKCAKKFIEERAAIRGVAPRAFRDSAGANANLAQVWYPGCREFPGFTVMAPSTTLRDGDLLISRSVNKEYNSVERCYNILRNNPHLLGTIANRYYSVALGKDGEYALYRPNGNGGGGVSRTSRYPLNPKYSAALPLP